jgi:hypothetical protein
LEIFIKKIELNRIAFGFFSFSKDVFSFAK